MVHDVRAFYALSVGEGVDLFKARALIEVARESGFTLIGEPSVRFKSGAHPLTVVEVEARINGFEIERAGLQSLVRLTLYQFGVCSVEFHLVTELNLEDLVSLSSALWQNERLSAEATQLTARLLKVVNKSVYEPELSSPEDYIVFIGKPNWEESQEGLGWINEHRSVISRILNSEQGELSTQEQEIALSGTVSYLRRDVTVLDWAAALVIGEDSSQTLEVIEFSNAVLLNLRELDSQLRKESDRLAEMKSTGFWRLVLNQIFGSRATLLNISGKHWRYRRMFASLDNPLDLVGDTYPERVYRELARGLRVKGYRSSIEANLSGLSDYRDRLRDDSRFVISRNLEIMIVLLFLYEVFFK